MSTIGAFDYVIVGGGTAGCLLADRLSESGRATVCLIEAGPPDRNLFIHLPAGYIRTLFNHAYTWQFRTEPSEGSGGRSIAATQGRTLGGSSSINGMVYNRGQAADFDHWAQLGNPGWGFSDVLPYFRRSERRIGNGDDQRRGRTGRLPITDLEWKHPLLDAFMEGVEQMGIPANPDYNSGTQDGVGTYQRAIHRGRRRSSAQTFLAAARGRPNLTVVTSTQTTGIQFEGKRAVGIRCRRPDGSETTATARREVIVSAGTINSPRLLQLSGVGPAQLLADNGIPIVHAIEGVGENLRDHWAVRVVAKVRDVRTINRMVTGLPLMGQALRWALGRPNILAVSPSLVHVFWKSHESMSSSDLQFAFTPASYREGIASLLDSYDGMTCGVWQQRPESRGHVRIASPDPLQAPLIQPNYLSNSIDKAAIISGVRLARRMLETSPLRRYFDGQSSPGPDVQTDDEILDFSRRLGSTVFHLVGTCRMGPETDRLAVVDHQLRVRGIDGMRVVDASIMPTMPSANTMASTYMIAEKAADMIAAGT
jgi:choline dehydrogenase